MTAKLGRMVDQHTLYLAFDDDISTIRFCDEKLWLYLQFYNPFNKQNL